MSSDTRFSNAIVSAAADDATHEQAQQNAQPHGVVSSVLGRPAGTSFWLLPSGMSAIPMPRPMICGTVLMAFDMKRIFASLDGLFD